MILKVSVNSKTLRLFLNDGAFKLFLKILYPQRFGGVSVSDFEGLILTDTIKRFLNILVYSCRT